MSLIYDNERMSDLWLVTVGHAHPILGLHGVVRAAAVVTRFGCLLTVIATLMLLALAAGGGLL